MTFFRGFRIVLLRVYIMLKKSSIRKICLAAFCLLILFILYLFPKRGDNSLSIPETTYTVTNAKDTIFLLDKNDYVARIGVAIAEDDVVKKANTIISYLTIGSDNANLIPNGFKPIIPRGTKVLSSTLADGNFKVDFSKELLEVSERDECRLIEALVYSLTGLNEIKSITILVEGEILNKLPHSQEFLNNPLDRSIGINKKYDVDSIKGTTKTTMYYLSKYDGYYYYVPVTKVSNDSKEKIEVIIKELASSPVYETSLMSYLSSETTLQNYKILDDQLAIDFNSAILSDVTKNDILEEVTYAINLSIKDNYDIDTVSYTVDQEEIAKFDLKSLE